MNKLEEDKKQINKMLDNIYEGLEFEDDEDIRELYLKQKHALKTALNYIDNSISKEVIEEKIEELKNRKMDIVTSPIYSRDEKLSILKRNQIKRKILQELLEGK